MEVTAKEKIQSRSNYVLRIPYRIVAILAIGYLVLPICIFFLTWLKLYLGIPATIILLFGFYRFVKTTYLYNKNVLEIPINHFLLILILFLLWIWTTGIGNFLVSVYDPPWRNAIFRDLISYDWPLIYPDTGNALVYYFFYWLVPALFGKIFGWTAGNIALFVWTYIGVLLVFLLLLHICKAKTSSLIWVCVILFFGWSGLNTLGAAVSQIININSGTFFALNCQEDWLTSLYNGYSFNFLYRSNNGTLEQIYNQATPLWITTLLAYENRNSIQNFAFLGLCLLPFAPLPFIGLLILLLSYFIHWIYISKKEKLKIPYLRTIFCFQNIAASITVFPVVLLFFMCNRTTSSSDGGGFMILPLELFDAKRIVGIILFWILQFGIIALLLYSENKKNYLYYVIVFSLMFIPFFEFGKHEGRDFCMNASLPALFLLMVLAIQYIKKKVLDKKLSLKSVVLIVVLTLSMLSPIQDIAGKVDTILDLKQFPIVNDSVYSFGNIEEENISQNYMENFLVPNPEDTIFFKYLAK